MEVLLYQQQINDQKHNITFTKDKLSYRGKRFDAIIAKKVRPQIEELLANGLHYPLLLELDDTDYFTKLVPYERNDGTKGMKAKITILGFQSAVQGEFDNKSLDEIVDDIEQEQAHKGE